MHGGTARRVREPWHRSHRRCCFGADPADPEDGGGDRAAEHDVVQRSDTAALFLHSGTLGAPSWGVAAISIVPVLPQRAAVPGHVVERLRAIGSEQLERHIWAAVRRAVARGALCR